LSIGRVAIAVGIAEKSERSICRVADAGSVTSERRKPGSGVPNSGVLLRSAWEPLAVFVLPVVFLKSA